MLSAEIVSDDRIRLRKFNENDVDNFYKAANESAKQLLKWFDWYQDNYSISQAEKFVKSREQAWATRAELSFLIEEKQDDRFIGVIGLNRIDDANKLANVGYWIRASAAGKGYATAALQLLAKYSFKNLNFNRLEILCLLDNLPSIRVAEKAGFKKEGVLRKRLIFRQNPHDVELLSLTPEDIG